MERDVLIQTLKRNLEWFRNSGVMVPEDGTWGMGERVVVTRNNEALERTLRAFTAATHFDGYCILEHRRADCNFEAALLFREAAEFAGEEWKDLAENLLYYLYCRSGLWMTGVGGVPKSVWQWSHITHYLAVYFDDNAWCLLISLAMGLQDPALDQRFGMVAKAEALADRMVQAMRRTFQCYKDDDPENWRDPAPNGWAGNLFYPHWGSLAVMALAAAYSRFPKKEYAIEIRRYCEFVHEKRNDWDVSELCYAVLGAAFAVKFMGDEFYREHLDELGSILLARRVPETGNFPSEHAAETPVGPEKVDTIYTVNWALLAMQCLRRLTGKEEYIAAEEDLLALMVKIQDNAPEKQFSGCWRGMYDLTTGSWGGGDCYEGGAASIYTGWTNAPISLAICFALQGKALTDLL